MGMTRAKEKLHLFSAKTRSVYGESRYKLRSRFIDEIANGIWAITEEATWCLPAHATRLKGDVRPVLKPPVRHIGVQRATEITIGVDGTVH